jgi:hypothetical protein
MIRIFGTNRFTAPAMGRQTVVSGVSLLVAFIICLVGSSVVAARTWTDRSGKYSVEAELVDFKDGKAILRCADGRVVSIRAAQLSAADQKYIREELRRRHESQTEERADKPKPAAVPDEPETVEYESARELCKLANNKVTESSGLACSRNAPGVFWTHNDSGDAPRVYAFNTEGKDLGACLVTGIRARDWEDMASFKIQGQSFLLLGDVGDNDKKNDVHELYLVREPPIDARRGVAVQQMPVLSVIRYRYEDGRHNCESVGVDPATRTILFVPKDGGQKCGAYAIPFPKQPSPDPVVARKIATLNIPTATGMDVSANGRRAVVVTYGDAYEYKRGADEDWAAAFARQPRKLPMPQRAQGESICYGPDGTTLYLTSEKAPTPLWEIPAKRPKPGKESSPSSKP